MCAHTHIHTPQGLISSDKVKLFLRMLKLKEFFTYVTFENGIKVRCSRGSIISPLTCPSLSPGSVPQCPLAGQERQQCSLLTDSILLREMAEELRWRQQGAQAEANVGGGGGAGGGGTLPNQEEKERGIPFQDVLK